MSIFIPWWSGCIYYYVCVTTSTRVHSWNVIHTAITTIITHTHTWTCLCREGHLCNSYVSRKCFKASIGVECDCTLKTTVRTSMLIPYIYLCWMYTCIRMYTCIHFSTVNWQENIYPTTIYWSHVVPSVGRLVRRLSAQRALLRPMMWCGVLQSRFSFSAYVCVSMYGHVCVCVCVWVCVWSTLHNTPWWLRACDVRCAICYVAASAAG